MPLSPSVKSRYLLALRIITLLQRHRVESSLLSHNSLALDCSMSTFPRLPSRPQCVPYYVLCQPWRDCSATSTTGTASIAHPIPASTISSSIQSIIPSPTTNTNNPAPPKSPHNPLPQPQHPLNLPLPFPLLPHHQHLPYRQHVQKLFPLIRTLPYSRELGVCFFV